MGSIQILATLIQANNSNTMASLPLPAGIYIINAAMSYQVTKLGTIIYMAIDLADPSGNVYHSFSLPATGSLQLGNTGVLTMSPALILPVSRTITFRNYVIYGTATLSLTATVNYNQFPPPSKFTATRIA